MPSDASSSGTSVTDNDKWSTALNVAQWVSVGPFIFVVVLCVVLLFLGLWQPTVVNQYYLTASFMTTYSSNLPQLTWAPNGTDGPFSTSTAAGVVSVLVQNALQCLNTAAVGPTVAPLCSDPTLANYTACMHMAPCVSGVALSSSATARQSAQAVYDGVWRCAAVAWPVSEGNRLGYAACVAAGDPYAVLEVMQDAYTSTIMGAYNWVILLLTAMWVLAAFATYTAFFDNDKYTADENGKYQWKDMFARTGVFFTSLALVWVVTAVVYIWSSTWRIAGAGNQSAMNNAPMSIQTTVVTQLFVLLTGGYFSAEIWEQWVLRGSGEVARVLAPPSGAQLKVKMVSDAYPNPARIVRRVGSRVVRATPLRYFMRTPDQNTGGGNATHAYQSTPLLITAWADALALSDALLVSAVVGATLDVVTAEVCLLFAATLAGGVVHAAMQRLLYEAYVSEFGDTAKDGFRMHSSAEIVGGDNAALYGVRVMAFAADVGCTFYTVAVLGIIFQRYSLTGVVLCYGIFVYLIPCVYWWIVHAVTEMCVDSALSYEHRHLFWAQLAFSYAVVVRCALGLTLFCVYGLGTSAAQTASAQLITDLAKWSY